MENEKIKDEELKETPEVDDEEVTDEEFENEVVEDSLDGDDEIVDGEEAGDDEKPEPDLPEAVKDDSDETLNEDLENPDPALEENKPVEEIKFTQSQVNALVGKARQEGRESALNELLSHYGVNVREEMDDIFGKGQAYESLNDEYAASQAFSKSVMAENALLKSQIDASRWDDVKLILQGKGLDVTTENIESMIPSHPEWRKTEVPVMEAKDEKPVATLRKLGNDASPEVDPTTDEEKARKLFGL